MLPTRSQSLVIRQTDVEGNKSQEFLDLFTNYSHFNPRLVE